MTDEEKQEYKEQINYDICDTVGEIYKLAREVHYDLESFSDLFLTSSFCKREFDTFYSCFQMDEDASMYYIEKEIGKKLIKNTNNISEDEAYWVGFMYRYIYIYSGINSDRLVDIITFNKMLSYINKTILPFEEYGPDELFDLMCKDFHLMNINNN